MRRRIFGGLIVVWVAVAGGTATDEATAQEAPETAVHLSADALEWGPLAPDVPLRRVSLWDERSHPEGDGRGMLLLVPAGLESGMRAQTRPFHGVTIQGTLVRTVEGDAEEKELPPGSYVFQPAGQFHKGRCLGPEDCVIFIHQHGRGDMLRPPAAR